MKELVVAVGFLVAATSMAFAQRHARSDFYYGFGPNARAHIIKVNAPGGARTYNVTARMPPSDALPTAGKWN